MSDVLWAIKQLLQDLPQNRDWLNPDIERILKDAVKTKPNPTVARIDKEIAFLQGEEKRLRSPPLTNERWAYSKADAFKDIIERLQNIRRDLQMTTLGGKRIEG